MPSPFDSRNKQRLFFSIIVSSHSVELANPIVRTPSVAESLRNLSRTKVIALTLGRN